MKKSKSAAELHRLQQAGEILRMAGFIQDENGDWQLPELSDKHTGQGEIVAPESTSQAVGGEE